MAHEGSNGKPDAEGGETSRERRAPVRRVIKPDAEGGETSRERRAPVRRVIKPDAEGGETSGSRRTSSRPATKKDPSEDSGAAKTKQPKKEDRGRGGRSTRNRFEE